MKKIKQLLFTSIALTFSVAIYGQTTTYKNEQGLIGIKDKESGKVLVEAKYKWLTSFKDDHWVARLSSNKVGLINKRGKTIIDFEYDQIYCCDYKGLYKVEVNGKEGYINKKGKQIIPVIYDKVFMFHEGRAKVVLNGENQFFNAKGDRVNRKGKKY